jgi:hypothetical protein
MDRVLEQAHWQTKPKAGAAQSAAKFKMTDYWSGGILGGVSRGYQRSALCSAMTL